MNPPNGLLALNARLSKAIAAHERSAHEIREVKRQIGGALRHIRDVEGLSIRDMATRCEVSPAMVHDFENGRRWSDALFRRLLHQFT